MSKNILIAPNSFRDSLSAFEAADAMKRGVARSGIEAVTRIVPMADGGDGTLQVLHHVLGGVVRTESVPDPLGRPVDAKYLELDDGVCFVEMAQASGNWLLSDKEKSPLNAHSYGTGLLMRRAIEQGAQRLVVGLGGSATVDGGVGLLQALGARFWDASGKELEPGPQGLKDVLRVDLDEMMRPLELEVWADVQTVLEDCVRLYGPQKGAVGADLVFLEKHLQKLSLLAPNPALAGQPMSGAAGGAAFGLAAFAGAEVRPGAEALGDLCNLEDKVAEADVIVTGEGCFDQTSLEGKATSLVLSLASKHRKMCLIFAGKLRIEPPDPIHRAFAISPQEAPVSEVLARAEHFLENAVCEVFRSRYSL